MWEQCDLEKVTKKRLIKDLGRTDGEQRFASYLHARQLIVEHVSDEIKAMQPNLTGHDSRHIRNVIENMHALIGPNADGLTGLELYLLLMVAFFHDVGNYYDRRDHQKKVQAIYDFVFPPATANNHEKMVVLMAVDAHCGKARDGSPDTLGPVSAQTQLYGKPIRLREISAILRFADELAEGTQRTSLFRLQEDNYPDGSRMYHDYSSIVEVGIDRGNQRVVLIYHLKLRTDASGTLDSGDEKKIRGLLPFAYDRIVKLNLERRYCRHYSAFLDPFKSTAVSFNYWIDGGRVDLVLNDLVFTDLVLPSDPAKSVTEKQAEYEVETILQSLRQQLTLRAT